MCRQAPYGSLVLLYMDHRDSFSLFGEWELHCQPKIKSQLTTAYSPDACVWDTLHLSIGCLFTEPLRFPCSKTYWVSVLTLSTGKEDQIGRAHV